MNEKLLPLRAEESDLRVLDELCKLQPQDVPALMELACDLDPGWLSVLRPHLNVQLAADRDHQPLWCALKRHPAALIELKFKDPEGTEKNLSRTAKAIARDETHVLHCKRYELTRPRTRDLTEEERARLGLEILDIVGRAKLFEGTMALTWLKPQDQSVLREAFDWLEFHAPASELIDLLHVVHKVYPDKARALVAQLWWTHLKPELLRLRGEFLKGVRRLTEKESLRFFVQLAKLAEMDQARAASVVEPEEWQELCQELKFVRLQRLVDRLAVQSTLLRTMVRVRKLYSKFFQTA